MYYRQDCQADPKVKKIIKRQEKIARRLLNSLLNDFGIDVDAAGTRFEALDTHPSDCNLP